MDVFPVATSTLSANALGEFLKEKYNFKDCTCELFRTGINHTYFISADMERYVLRIYFYNWRSESEIMEEILLLNELKQVQINISHPIADQNGSYIQNIHAPEGMRHAVLFSFANGKKIRFMNEETCFAIGTLMAKIHKETQDKTIGRIHYNPETLLQQPYEYAKAHFSESLPEMQFVQKQGQIIGENFKKMDLIHLAKGVVHLDIWYDNMNVADANEITIFDFDFCGNGLLVFDVAYFCKQLFHIETDKDRYELKAQSFLKGYQSIRKLSDAEIKFIPDAATSIWIFYLGVQSQRFDWSNIFLTENYLKIYVGKMKSWMDYYSNKLS
ncbi:protein kinase [Flavobacterium noncentrifugens]|uniref:Ser/Thr protein kinase RdoA involved in Cpx stress response, MazF antagonist n=1 Tax=Flavobacterium noncentrifugens TaxID=1128970 RepID=A0A1G8UP57_9FLAO|nr:phosphotransferase [Flavobacterium noncentrifugens]GEP52622.1 protein kinase [Flavobacterium noncentrifugens]SDJ55551.1 Ser/Thr protein kinase RdoA involved in Cpx stress response, MazF antagonist [Flavobacterium noncentrifugens]